jgi:hypothetical protein
MKNYIYVSQRKVDELYEQIPKHILEKIAMELHIDLKVMGVGLSSSVRPFMLPSCKENSARVIDTMIPVEPAGKTSPTGVC